MRGHELDAFGPEDNLRLGARFSCARLKFQCGTQLARCVFGAERNEPGAMAARLFGGQGNVRTGSERDHFEMARERVDYAETLAADGACRAQDSDAFHAVSILTTDRGFNQKSRRFTTDKRGWRRIGEASGLPRPWFLLLGWQRGKLSVRRGVKF